MDTDGTASRAGASRAGSTAPIPVTKPASKGAPQAAPKTPAPKSPTPKPVAPTPVAAKPTGVKPSTPGPAATPPRGIAVPPAGARPAATGFEPSAPYDSRVGSGVPAAATGPASAAAAPPVPARPTGPRRARLLVTRLDPWSVMKTAFMLSVSIGIVVLMSTALLWWTLDVTGVFAAVGRTIDDLAGSGSSSFDFLAFVGFSRVMGVALVLTAIEIVLGSALSTLFAFLYNLSVGLTGGLEVTLSEDS